MSSGNKGEWSEFYAFLKTLTENKLYAADDNLQKIAEKFFIILKVIREESDKGVKIYEVSENGSEIKISDSSEKEIGIANFESIKSKVASIFEAMKNSSDRTFSISLANEAMEELHCTQIKAGNNKKEDLSLVVHDSFSPTAQQLGFSIKSMIGSASTLLNAGRTTNIVYKIVNNERQNRLDETDEINSIDGASKIRDRMEQIQYGLGNLEYLKIDDERFRDNLQMIDTLFPQMIAEVVKAFYSGKGSTIVELVDALEKEQIILKKFGVTTDVFSYKIKQFLSAIALGMTPSKKWDGRASAHGGYIIVREDGELVCYHLYNRNEFEDYLFKNTRLETASTKRHGFGTVYKDQENYCIKLNLQIRFIK